MKVRVRLFAAARQAAGCDVVELELPAQTTIAELRRRLQQDRPELSAVTEAALFAVNAEYAGETLEIPPGAEVACIPPVSGG